MNTYDVLGDQRLAFETHHEHVVRSTGRKKNCEKVTKNAEPVDGVVAATRRSVNENIGEKAPMIMIRVRSKEDEKWRNANSKIRMSRRAHGVNCRRFQSDVHLGTKVNIKLAPEPGKMPAFDDVDGQSLSLRFQSANGERNNCHYITIPSLLSRIMAPIKIQSVIKINNTTS